MVESGLNIPQSQQLGEYNHYCFYLVKTSARNEVGGDSTAGFDYVEKHERESPLKHAS